MGEKVDIQKVSKHIIKRIRKSFFLAIPVYKLSDEKKVLI